MSGSGIKGGHRTSHEDLFTKKVSCRLSSEFTQLRSIKSVEPSGGGVSDPRSRKREVTTFDWNAMNTQTSAALLRCLACTRSSLGVLQRTIVAHNGGTEIECRLTTFQRGSRSRYSNGSTETFLVLIGGIHASQLSQGYPIQVERKR